MNKYRKELLIKFTPENFQGINMNKYVSQGQLKYWKYDNTKGFSMRYTVLVGMRKPHGVGAEAQV